MYNLLLAVGCIYFTLIVNSESKARKDVPAKKKWHSPGESGLKYWLSAEKSCWTTMNAKQHIDAMNNLEAKYKDVRRSWSQALEKDIKRFDQYMLKVMIRSRGKLRDSPPNIPAGLNLGGYCMLRMHQSVLFFHRMKLRNNTIFRINRLKTDMFNMRIVAQLSLNDLHLFGSYERAITDPGKPSSLFYTPTFGQVEILLKNVAYKLEGRLRLSDDNPFITLTVSEIDFADALMIYQNNATNLAKPVSLTQSNIGDFLDRMKSDLDAWLRDYFNQHLIFFTRVGEATNQKFWYLKLWSIFYNITNTNKHPKWNYEMEKTAQLNKFVEDSIDSMKAKLHEVNATAARLPDFELMAVDKVRIFLQEGVLRGLDSMYRRSVATGGVEGPVRNVDAIIGFSNLKVMYRYTVILPTGVAPLIGKLLLAADELTAHMAMSLVKDPDFVELNFDSIQQLKPESLTVEGPGNRMIANFKHLLEHHIISIMTNGLIHNVKALKTLVKCKPNLFGEAENDGPEVELPADFNDDFNDQENNVESAAELATEENANKLVSDEAGELERPTQTRPNQNSQKTPDYIVNKVDSIEIELAPNAGANQGKRVHFNYAENLNITNLN